MPLNTFTLGLSFGDLPEFCGPDDLSDAIIGLRRSERQPFGPESLAPISDEAIRRLMRLAFYTSFAAEEGKVSVHGILD